MTWVQLLSMHIKAALDGGACKPGAKEQRQEECRLFRPAGPAKRLYPGQLAHLNLGLERAWNLLCRHPLQGATASALKLMLLTYKSFQTGECGDRGGRKVDTAWDARDLLIREENYGLGCNSVCSTCSVCAETSMGLTHHTHVGIHTYRETNQTDTRRETDRHIHTNTKHFGKPGLATWGCTHREDLAGWFWVRSMMSEKYHRSPFCCPELLPSMPANRGLRKLAHRLTNHIFYITQQAIFTLSLKWEEQKE